MKRVLLRVAYDGTGYHGFQAQNNAETIEGQLNRAISKLTNAVNMELIGGSRTDAGVHARDNVVVFDTESSIPGEKFSYALNQLLPDDIKIVHSEEVAGDFHPRHCDTVKTYEYHICNSEFADPMKRFYSYYNYYPLNIDNMRKAAKYIEGEHDFTSFCTVGAQSDIKVRTVYSVEVLAYSNREMFDGKVTKPREENVDIFIRVRGNGFLYNMVRIIAGTLMEVGRGSILPEEVEKIIEAKDRSKAGPTAPPEGLTLLKYEFV